MNEKRKPPCLRSQEMFAWLTDEDAIMGEEYGLEWRRRLVAQVVAKKGVWVKGLAGRLSHELADAITKFADNEVYWLDGYGVIAYQMIWEGLYHTDWMEVAEAILEKDGFYSGPEPQAALPKAEVEAYLDRTAPKEEVL